jgi:hypothetical protein
LVKNRTNDTSVAGTFSYDMNITRDRWNYKSIGQLTTADVTLLSPRCTQTSVTVNTFDILKLTESEMVLGYPSAGDNTGQSGAATYWYFVAIE